MKSISQLCPTGSYKQHTVLPALPQAAGRHQERGTVGTSMLPGTQGSRSQLKHQALQHRNCPCIYSLDVFCTIPIHALKDESATQRASPRWPGSNQHYTTCKARGQFWLSNDWPRAVRPFPLHWASSKMQPGKTAGSMTTFRSLILS